MTAIPAVRLTVAARIADQALRQSRVLDAVFLLAGLVQRAAVEADDRGVTETGIDVVEAGGVETSSYICPPITLLPRSLAAVSAE